MRSAITLGLGILIAAATPGLRAQVSPSTPNSVKSALGGVSAPAQAAPAAKSSGSATVTSSKQQAGKGKSKGAKPKGEVKAVEKPSTPGTAPEAAESEVKQARRDPFESLIGVRKTQAVLPPGKLGLQVSTLRLDGIVRSPNGMIAVVSNPQSRTYFLREGDRLYDGSVEKISMDGVSFHEEGKDAFGKPVEHQVNKRIYSSPGEQQ
jgi:Tfp pilus assembly protein PilP